MHIRTCKHTCVRTKGYLFVSLRLLIFCARARARVRVRVRVRVCVCARARVRVRARACACACARVCVWTLRTKHGDKTGIYFR